jgi:hypothetical protein
VLGRLPFLKGHHRGLFEENGVLRGEHDKPFQGFAFPRIFDYALIEFGNNDHLLGEKVRIVLLLGRIT